MAPMYVAVLALVAVSLCGCGLSGDRAHSSTTKTTTVFVEAIALSVHQVDSYNPSDDFRWPRCHKHKDAPCNWWRVGDCKDMSEDHGCILKDSDIKMIAFGTCTGTWKIELVCHMTEGAVSEAEYPFNETLDMKNSTIVIPGMQRRLQCSFFGLGFNYTYGLNDNCTLDFSGTINGHCDKSAVPGNSTIMI